MNQRESDTTSIHGEEDLIHTPHLREVCFGVKEGYPRGTSVEEACRLRAEAQGVPVDEIKDFAESPEQIIERQHHFIKTVTKDLLSDINSGIDIEDGASVFCLSHGRFIKTFLNNICELQEVDKIKNCAISIVRLAFSVDNGVIEYECSAISDNVNLTPEEYNLKNVADITI